MQAIVVDAEVVSDLVHDGDVDLFDDVLVCVADAQRRVAVDRDAIRQRSGVCRIPLRQGNALVEPEQVGVFGRAIGLDDEDDVVDEAGVAQPAKAALSAAVASRTQPASEAGRVVAARPPEKPTSAGKPSTSASE